MNEYDQLLARGGLSLERLATLCRVVDAGGLTKAAGGDVSRLSLYSRQIKDLESFFSLPLVRKVGRVAVPTAHAKAIAASVRAHLKQLQAHVGAEVQLGPFVLASSQSLQEWYLAPRLVRLGKALGNRTIRLMVMRSREIAEALEDHRLDMALIRHDALPPGMKSKPVMKLTYALFAPKTLAAGATPRKVIQNLPLAIPLGGRLREQVEQAARKAGLTLKIGLEASSFTLCADAVNRGLYAAILPSIAESALDADRVVKLPLPLTMDLARNIVAAWHPAAPDGGWKTMVKLLASS
ncbi:MAG TPA: LysR family transcriptional regulator [Kiritimatiellia bacterium]|nr:LysR family transcriptional regulator [Kiritimatiellia bacterium]